MDVDASVGQYNLIIDAVKSDDAGTYVCMTSEGQHNDAQLIVMGELNLSRSDTETITTTDLKFPIKRGSRFSPHSSVNDLVYWILCSCQMWYSICEAILLIRQDAERWYSSFTHGPLKNMNGMWWYSSVFDTLATFHVLGLYMRRSRRWIYLLFQVADLWAISSVSMALETLGPRTVLRKGTSYISSIDTRFNNLTTSQETPGKSSAFSSSTI